MKKTLSTLLAAALATSAMAYTPIKGRTQKTYDLASRINRSPEQVAEFVRDRVEYRSDVAGVFVNHRGIKRRVTDDYCQTPLDTYLRGYGDCEDFAVFAASLLNRFGYQAKLYAFYKRNDNEGHAVCVVKEGSRFSVISNGKYTAGYRSVDEFIQKECPSWGMYEEFVIDQSQVDGTLPIRTVYRDKSQEKFWDE